MNSSDECFIIDPAQRHSPEPTTLWAAPHSLFVGEVVSAWAWRGRVSDLGSVSGPWAVALWDLFAHEHLLVVDPLGVQPLFWARTSDGRIAAASWLAHLVDRPDVDDSLDYEGILLDQGFDFEGADVLHRTRFAAVSRVPWGRLLRIKADGSTRIEQYWDQYALPGPDNSLSLNDCAELLRERIDVAVRKLTPTDVRVGAHVSGGLDCTAVASRAHQILNESGGGLVAGYSWAPSEARVPRFQGDERQLLDDVALDQGIPVRTVHPDESGDWFWRLDPNRYPDSTHLRECWTLPQAKADGVQVMLSGWGGDEASSFNGRCVVPSLVRHGHLPTVWREANKRQELFASEPVPLGRRVRAFAGAVHNALPRPVRSLRHRGRIRALRVRTRPSFDAASSIILPARGECSG